MKKIYAIYGASGFGREVMPLLKNQISDKKNECEFIFVDDGLKESIINDCKVFNYKSFLDIDASEKNIVVAIADGYIRRKLTEKISNDNINLFNISANNNVIMDCVNIKDGYILSPFVTLTSNINIGIGFHANIYSYVAHDCKIGDYVTFAPGVKCNGNVVIEDHAYIGAGAIIKQGTPEKQIVIGKGAIIGMGAVVTKSVLPGKVVVGNPAKELIKL